MSWRDRIAKALVGREYPVAPRGEWYGDANYAMSGGRMTTMSPSQYLQQTHPMKMDELTRENVDLLKQHIEEGRTLDPLALYKNMKEDGRHRAIAAQELDIGAVPVLNWRPELPASVYQGMAVRPQYGTFEP